MDALIEQVGYAPDSGEKLDGILSPADCISSGIIFTLKKKGFTVDNIPVITGQDSTPEALKNIQEGYQAMTILKDGKQLQNAVLEMVKAISQGKEATHPIVQEESHPIAQEAGRYLSAPLLW